MSPPTTPLVRSLTFSEEGSSHCLAQFAKEAGVMKGKLQLANGQFEKRKSPPGQKWRDRKGERERVKGSVCVCVFWGFCFGGGTNT